MVVRELTDHRTLANFLRETLVDNAYPLGYLDEAYTDMCLWYGAMDPALQTVLLVYTGLSRPGLFTAGDPLGVAPILKALGDRLPDAVTVHIDRAHLDGVRSRYREPARLRPMRRMGLAHARFHDPGPPPDDIRVEVLSHRDTAAILRLYSHWPDHFFDPYQLETRLYFGARDDHGELVCIAGVHNVSPAWDIAAIGNLVTHPDHRGRGLARHVTAALLREAFTRVGEITLDVEEGNTAAQHLYRHFGFRFFAEFWEGEMRRTG